MNRMLRLKNCDRCKKKLISRTMSYLNKEILCLQCKEEEKTHPLYEKAKQKELEALKRGDYDYPGLLEGFFYE